MYIYPCTYHDYYAGPCCKGFIENETEPPKHNKNKVEYVPAQEEVSTPAKVNKFEHGLNAVDCEKQDVHRVQHQRIVNLEGRKQDDGHEVGKNDQTNDDTKPLAVSPRHICRCKPNDDNSSGAAEGKHIELMRGHRSNMLHSCGAVQNGLSDVAALIIDQIQFGRSSEVPWTTQTMSAVGRDSAETWLGNLARMTRA